MLILKSDPIRYGTLQETLFDDVYKGRDEFPTTLTAAYDLLQHKALSIAHNPRHNRFRFRRDNKRYGNNFTFAQA